ncbi:MAG: TonB-dependent receptor [Ignavibacteriales bacterium]|nr:TonB-dependent receptor [Ignavibacteriales bacterium]
MSFLLRYCLAGLFVFPSLLAQPSVGTIAGSVADSATGLPLAGANVVLRGTVLGTATNASGEFRLNRVPSGVYSVVVSMVGYQRVIVSDIVVIDTGVQSIRVALHPMMIQMEQVVVTASRREQSLQDVPVSVSTVTAEMIAARNHITLDDALRYVPGVNLMQDQVNIRGSSGYSRGVGSRVLLLLDGLPFLTGDTGEINWEVIPVHEVERVEVVKGAGSALYGSSALGGVINVLTRDASDAPRIRARVFSGLYDQPRFAEWEWSRQSRFNSGVMVSYSDKTGPLGYLMSVARTVDEGYRQNDAYHRWSVYTKLKYDLSSSQSLTVSGNLLQRIHGNFFWWRNLREATRPADDQLNGRVESVRGNIGFSYREFVSDRFFYSMKGIYFGNSWDDYTGTRRNYFSRSDLVSLEFQGTYEFPPRHILTFGAAGNYDRVNANLFGAHPGIGGAAYVQDEVELLERLKGTVGLRFDWQKVSALPSTSEIHPKVGVVYSLDSETRIRASYGSGFRYPSISEIYIESPKNISQVPILPNPALLVEKSSSMEVGASSTLGSSIAVDAAVFSSSFTNLIEPGVAFNDANEPYIRFDNVTKARIQGMELSVNIEWWKRLFSTNLGYTYIWPRDLTQQTMLQFRPQHIFYSSATISLGHLRLSTDVRYVSRIERIDENLVRFAPIPQGDERVPINVIDVRASYDAVELGVPLRVGLNVNNVANYHYVELIGNLAPVRTYFLILEGIF